MFQDNIGGVVSSLKGLVIPLVLFEKTLKLDFKMPVHYQKLDILHMTLASKGGLNCPKKPLFGQILEHERLFILLEPLVRFGMLQEVISKSIWGR